MREKSLRALFVGIVLCVLATLLLEGGGCDVSEGPLFNRWEKDEQTRPANKTREAKARARKAPM